MLVTVFLHSLDWYFTFVLFFFQWWTLNLGVKLRRGCRMNPSGINTARTYGALWRSCLFRTGLSWWSGSLSWPTTKSSTRCWFSLQSRTSWWSYWTCTGCLFYARISDPPAAGLSTAVLFYESNESTGVKNSYQGAKWGCCKTELFYSHYIVFSNGE